jgi:hypothetical protein
LATFHFPKRSDMSTPPTVVAVTGASGYRGVIDTGSGVEDAAAIRSLTREG